MSKNIQAVALINSSETVMEPPPATYYDAIEKTWHGPKFKPLYNEDITLGEVIYESLKRNSNKIIQIHAQTGEQLTCSELLEYSENLSRNLLKLGLKPGDVIGMHAYNWTHVVTLMLASFLCGTPVNAIFPGSDKETASYIFNITKPKIIFCDRENLSVTKDVAEDLNLQAPLYILNGETPDLPHVRDLLKVEAKQDNFRFPCLELKCDDTATILCSSGTTGLPKCVLCPHGAFLHKKIFYTLPQESVLFSFSTVSLATGLLTLTASLLNASLRIITAQAFTPEYFLHLVREYKITHARFGSLHMTELALCQSLTLNDIQKSLESIETLLVAGNKIPLNVRKKIDNFLGNTKKRGLSVSYGMSEFTGIVSINNDFTTERVKCSEGKLAANCMLRIINKKGERLGPLEHGEICIYFPFKWQRYYNNPEASLKAMRDNWFYSGDIGYFDEQGDLFVCGRMKDVFTSKEAEVCPPQIEEIILQIPGIKEACIVGIPNVKENNLIACVVACASNEDGESVTTEKVDNHVKICMGIQYHLSGGVYFVDSIPRTGSGKMQRQKVLDMIINRKEMLHDNNNINMKFVNGKIKSL